MHTFSGHRQPVYTLAPQDGQHFFSAGADGMVVQWDLAEPDMGKMLVQIPASVYALAFAPYRQVLVAGQNHSGIHLIDLHTRQEVGSLALTSAPIFDILTTPDYLYVASGNGELFCISWDLRILRKAHLSTHSLRTLALHPERNELAAGYSDHRIRILDARTLRLKHEIAAHNISVFTLQYHPHLPVLLSGSRDARLKIWDADRQYAQVEEVVAHMYAINHLTFSPDGRYFATGSMDKSVKVWDAATFKLLKVIDKARHAGHGTSVNKLLWMDYHNWLLSCSDDRSISVWDIAPGH